MTEADRAQRNISEIARSTVDAAMKGKAATGRIATRAQVADHRQPTARPEKCEIDGASTVVGNLPARSSRAVPWRRSPAIRTVINWCLPAPFDEIPADGFCRNSCRRGDGLLMAHLGAALRGGGRCGVEGADSPRHLHDAARQTSPPNPRRPPPSALGAEAWPGRCSRGEIDADFQRPHSTRQDGRCPSGCRVRFAELIIFFQTENARGY